jgi:geranylgeranyl pyrophosphate synthase
LEGKRTLIAIHALSHAPQAKARRLREIMSSRSCSEQEIGEATNIMREAGSVDYAWRRAGEFATAAKERLASFPAGNDRESLIRIADYVLSREE